MRHDLPVNCMRMLKGHRPGRVLHLGILAPRPFKSDCAVQSSSLDFSKSDCTLQSSDCTLQNSDCTLQSSDCTLQSSDCALQSSSLDTSKSDCTLQSLSDTSKSTALAFLSLDTPPPFSPFLPHPPNLSPYTFKNAPLTCHLPRLIQSRLSPCSRSHTSIISSWHAYDCLWFSCTRHFPDLSRPAPHKAAHTCALVGGCRRRISRGA